MGNKSSSAVKATPEAASKHVIVVGAGPGGASMAHIADMAGFQKAVVPLRSVIAGPKSTRVQDDAVRWDPAVKKLALASGKQLSYDFIVLAVGSQNASPAEPPLGAWSLAEIRAHFEGVNNAIRAAKKVVVVGGGAVGVEMAGQIRDAVGLPGTVTIVHSGSALVDASLPGAEGKKLSAFQARIAKLCKDAQIDVILNTRTSNIGPADCPGGYKYAAEPFTVELNNGTSLAADLVIWCVGGRSNAPQLVPGDFLEPRSGLVKVKRTLEVEGAEGAFALGDCCNLPEPKLLATARSQVGGPPGMPLGHSDIILRNLVELAKGTAATHLWPPPTSIISVIPVTRKTGGASLGAPNFLASLKASTFEYFASTFWGGANAGKYGKQPVIESEETKVAPRPEGWSKPRDAATAAKEQAEFEAAAAERAAAAVEATGDEATEADTQALVDHMNKDLAASAADQK